MALMRLIGFVALRALVIVACAGLCAIVAALVGSALPSQSSSDWGFGRLLGAVAIGGGLGLAIGFALAVRLGRRWFATSSRMLQSLAALAVPPVLMAGSWMERSHVSNTPGLTILPEEGSPAPQARAADTLVEQPPPAPTPPRPTPPPQARHDAGR